VRDPGADGDLGRDVGDGAVGDADDDEVRPGDVQLAPCDARGELLGEARGHGGADATGADDTG
jgi:hypothetical protein